MSATTVQGVRVNVTTSVHLRLDPDDASSVKKSGRDPAIQVQSIRATVDSDGLFMAGSGKQIRKSGEVGTADRIVYSVRCCPEPLRERMLAAAKAEITAEAERVNALS